MHYNLASDSLASHMPPVTLPCFLLKAIETSFQFIRYTCSFCLGAFALAVPSQEQFSSLFSESLHNLQVSDLVFTCLP